MSFDLSAIQKSQQLPPRIVLYGVQGIGKTTFAAGMPSPVFLPVEDGLGELEVPAFPRPQTYEDTLEAIASLYEGEHDYATLVIDGLNKLEPIIWDETCRKFKIKGEPATDIEAYGFGKGYVHALSVWRDLMEVLDQLREETGMTICILAHSSIEKYEPPDADPYDRYNLSLQKKAAGPIYGWADCVLFANYKVHVVQKGEGSDKKRGVGKGERSLFTTERPAYIAKNRYRMPDELPLEWEAVGEYLFKKKPAKKKAAKKTAKQEA